MMPRPRNFLRMPRTFWARTRRTAASKKTATGNSTCFRTTASRGTPILSHCAAPAATRPPWIRKTHTFSTSSLDCYTCHGVAPQNHPNDISLVWFSTKHSRDPKQIVSICGQCHLREGKSKSSGLPYPNNFVAGDDLFHDFQVDLAKADDGDLNPGDRHIYRNARDVVMNGGKDTCLSCHNVHGDSTRKHRLVLTGEICLDCHYAEGPKKNVKKYVVHSSVCQY